MSLVNCDNYMSYIVYFGEYGILVLDWKLTLFPSYQHVG